MRALSILISAVCAFSMTGMGSCSGTLQTACQTNYPAFQESLGDALTVLQAWNQPLEVRGLAAETPAAVPQPAASAVPAIAVPDRDSWERWAEAHLKEVEHYIDLAKAAHEPRVTAELSSIATELVTFHGQAERGHLERMIAALKRIDGHAMQARSLACEASP